MIWFISVLLVLSIALNVCCIWYIKYAVKKLLFVSDNLGEFLNKIVEYKEHLELLNSMEAYYGDEVIENFVKHTKAIVKEIKSYEEIYSLTHEDTNNEEGEEGKEEEA